MRGDPKMPEVRIPIRDDALSGVTGGRYTGPVFVYEIREGENLTILAQRFGTTVRVLQELNGIQTQSDVYVGLNLWVPQR